MIKFSLLWATRGRRRVYPAVPRWWRETAANPERIELVLCTDEDDEVATIERYEIANPDIHVINKGKGNVAAYNTAAEVCTGDVLIQVMDDVNPCLNWDEQILRQIPDVDEPWVVGIADGPTVGPIPMQPGSLGRCIGYGAKKRICTIFCCTRAWYEHCGYLYYPEYYSMYADDDITEKARKEGRLLECWSEICMPHNWGMWGRDEVWKETNKEAHRILGRALLQKRRANGFTGGFRDGAGSQDGPAGDHDAVVGPEAGGSRGDDEGGAP